MFAFLLAQDLSTRQEVVSVSEINKRVGISVTAEEAARLLTRMQLPSQVRVIIMRGLTSADDALRRRKTRTVLW
jgi:hypothetical protein